MSEKSEEEAEDSFEDSDRFEEDSLCSWMSEPDSLCNHWRGWKKSNNLLNSTNGYNYLSHINKNGQILSLVELSARVVALNIPFELVENVFPPVPEQLQLRIAFWSFPENEEDIRLYSCLANGNADEYSKGEATLKQRYVKDLLQIGFHLSASVVATPVNNNSNNNNSNNSNNNNNNSKGCYNVAITFDRKRITSCNCTCESQASWCSHVVAVCLFRIHQPNRVCLRAPISESLSRLGRDQLQKFAQYLISELPQQILPTAQRLLDDLLSSQKTDINTVSGAPDPTAGASINEQTSWCLDESQLHENIRKILLKLCSPSPVVLSDVNGLSSTAPPAASEWTSLLRPLRGREPEGIWNLLAIVREMFRRGDQNAIPLLEILTVEVMSCEQIICWWFTTKSSLHARGNGHGNKSNVQNSTHASQHASSSLCDEIVVLWRLACLNPSLTPAERKKFESQMIQWHFKALSAIAKIRHGNNGNNNAKKGDLNLFPGFRPSLEACLFYWQDSTVQGVNFDDISQKWYTDSEVLNSKSDECKKEPDRKRVERTVTEFLETQPNSLFKTKTGLEDLKSDISVKNGSNRSSFSSEGFCETSEIEQIDSDFAANTNDCKEELKVLNDNLAENECATNSDKAQISSSDHDSHSESENISLSDNCEEKGSNDISKNMKANQGKNDDYDIYKCNSNMDRQMIGSSKRSTASAPYSSSVMSKSFLEITQHWESEHGKKEIFRLSVKRIEETNEILFAKAEALHAHGMSKEACRYAVKLAEELLHNQPNLLIDLPNPSVRGKRIKRFNPAWHQVSLLASTTLSKSAFLCQVLAENEAHQHLAFQVGLFGLELSRHPASTKALEVKLANQEQELVTLIKRIPLREPQLVILREKAKQLRDGKYPGRGEALLPLILANYIFDALVVTSADKADKSDKSDRGDKSSNSNVTIISRKDPGDSLLGFEASVATLGMKANVSEAEHPLLCEGTRRQRGDFAIQLLVHYKDDPDKLSKIMDKLLDKDVHQMFKNGNRPNEVGVASGGLSPEKEVTNLADKSGDKRNEEKRDERQDATSPGWDENYKTWEARFRCANFKTAKKRSVGMASIDSSAPETTSSDNSPTVVRRTWIRPGSDSGSSGESSDSFASSSSGDQVLKHKLMTLGKENENPRVPTLTNRVPSLISNDGWQNGRTNSSTNTSFNIVMPSTSNVGSLASTSRHGSSFNNPQSTKFNRFKGKRMYPSIPNQPSEASAHFMFELAKTVLNKAGGNNTTTDLFSPQSTSSTHRALHICAFQIGVYALGLHNAVSRNWISRTYSSHASWITNQAMEIGATAINFLINTWEGHLTPTEVANIADRASQGRDASLIRAATKLALSCLPQAYALNKNEIQKALLQCKEDSTEMLEEACLAVESAAKGGGLCPDILFHLAKQWYELYEGISQPPNDSGTPKDRKCGNYSATNIGSFQVSSQNSNSNSSTTYATITNMNGSRQNERRFTDRQGTENVVNIVGNGTRDSNNEITNPLPMMPTIALPSRTYGQYFMSSIGTFHNNSIQIHPFFTSNPPLQYPFLHNANTGPPLITSIGGIENPNIYHSPFVHPNIGCTVPIGSTPRITMIPASNGNGSLVFPITSDNVYTQPHYSPYNGNSSHQSTESLSPAQYNYLLSAYRVALLAMEALERKVHDERPQFKYKYDSNAMYREDVKWSLGIVKKLGTSYLQDFCMRIMSSVVDPFLLHDVIIDSANYLVETSSLSFSQAYRSPIVAPLIQKCQQMFFISIQQRINSQIPNFDYDEFFHMLRSAKVVFLLTPGGAGQFNELIISIKRSKLCKKDLWQVLDSLQPNQ